MILLIIASLVAVAVGLFLAPGVGLLGLIPLLLAILAVVWAALAFAMGTSPAQAVRRTKRPDLLGPGGPDDPDASRDRIPSEPVPEPYPPPDEGDPPTPVPVPEPYPPDEGDPPVPPRVVSSRLFRRGAP